MTAEQWSAEPSTEMISKMAGDTVEYRIWVALTLARIGRDTNEHAKALRNLTQNGCSMAPLHRELERRVELLESRRPSDRQPPAKGVSFFRGLVDFKNYSPKEVLVILVVLGLFAINLFDRVDIVKLKEALSMVTLSTTASATP